MSEIFVISDTHFNHENLLGFKQSDGTPCRNEFDDVYHMNEVMIERWNRVVTPWDKVYHLGDVYMGSQSKAEEILSRLNGKKRLIVGNHDTVYGKGNPLQKYFQKIYMWRIFKEFGLLLTHVPVHPSVLGEGRHKTNNGKEIPKTMNVHGHTHYNGSPPGPYKSVCVELVNYTPVNIEELRTK